MIFIIAAAVVVSFVLILGFSYIAIYHFYNKIYIPYKKKVYYMSFEDAINVLKLIINTELDAYELDIFISKGSITNSNFDNFYKDLTSKIIEALSQNLIENLSMYIDESMIYVIIARSVKKFLTEKINGTI